MRSFATVFTDGSVCYRPGSCLSLIEAAEVGTVRLRAVGRGGYPGRPLPKGDLPELRSAGYWDAGGDQEWGLDWHRNEGIEFTYLSRGRLDFCVDDQTKEILPEHFTVTRPWQVHRVGTPRVSASRLAWVILDVGVRRPNQNWVWPDWILLTKQERARLAILLRQNEQPIWRADAEIARAFQRLMRSVETDTRFDRTGIILAINELMVGILNLLETQNVPTDKSLTSSQRTVEIFLAQLESHVDEVWTLDRMAEDCGLKRSRFSGYCWALKNQSPIQYLNHVRIEAAARMLREKPAASVLDVALDCGFTSSQMFATTFRRIKGVSPSGFRISGD